MFEDLSIFKSFSLRVFSGPCPELDQEVRFEKRGFRNTFSNSLRDDLLLSRRQKEEERVSAAAAADCATNVQETSDTVHLGVHGALPHLGFTESTLESQKISSSRLLYKKSTFPLGPELKLS